MIVKQRGKALNSVNHRVNCFVQFYRFPNKRLKDTLINYPQFGQNTRYIRTASLLRKIKTHHLR